MKRSRTLVLTVVGALAAALGAVWLAPAAYAAGVTASFAKTSDWGSGWEAKYTITNGGGSTVNGWSLAFDLPTGTTLGSYWDALLTSNGQRHTFTNRSWNGAIAPGASVSFGFLGNGPGVPANCRLNGAACAGGATPTTPPPTTPPPTTPPPTTPPPTTPPPTTPPPTTPPPVTGLPKHILTGYWHNFDNPAVELRLRDVPTEYDLVAVAFADATTTPGAVAFAIDPGLSASLGGYTDADFSADVRTLQSRGKKVIISVGGETGRVAVNDAASAVAFADSVYALIQRYGFDGVDVDLENGLNPTYMAQALRSLRAKVGSRLIIAMAPQTIDMQNPTTSYFKLALDIKDILTVVNTQFYNSGAMLGCDNNAAYAQGTVNFIVALACIQLEAGLRPDQVGLGLPAGPGAAGGGIVAPSVVNAAMDCLTRGANCGSFRPPRTYPGLRGAMTWSINWDVTHNNSFARTVAPHLRTLP
ncbi:chitinase [Micromonospora craniellae]|uniref:chitinase n=1 Tax=Micromonospora craniellae TaxID=2294034 RepID=A0A372G5P3_9ACTN|nr:cellulose binding domain-containing protein [Micromonospora craniellae]QOC90539.1 cellulose binding domain-containing protein [Micromonospora craniellae]RFS48079.1 cellulose-binding protein [Micromonospora craniellae]